MYEGKIQALFPCIKRNLFSSLNIFVENDNIFVKEDQRNSKGLFRAHTDSDLPSRDNGGGGKKEMIKLVKCF